MRYLLALLNRLLIMVLSRDQRDMRREYRQFVKACDKLLADEKALVLSERRRDAYSVVRDEAVALREKIVATGRSVEYDFILHQVRGVVIRTTLIIKNIESNSKHSDHYRVVSVHRMPNDDEVTRRVKAVIERATAGGYTETLGCDNNNVIQMNPLSSRS